MVKQALGCSAEPEDGERFTREPDRMYTLLAGTYHFATNVFPVWKTWLRHALPYIRGPKVLEVSFCTGYLLTQYVDRFETYGVDYNEKMLSVAGANLEKKGSEARLPRGNVESLPNDDESPDCIGDTMASTAYLDRTRAMSELHQFNFEYTGREIGDFGAVHLYVVDKR